MSREPSFDQSSPPGDDFFASFVEGCSDPVISLDADGGVVYANPAVGSLLGYDPAALRGRPLTDLIPDDDPDGQTRAFRSRLSNVADLCESDDVACLLRHADGRLVAFSVRFHEHTSSGEPMYTGVFRRDAGEAAHRDLRAFRNVVEHAGHAIYITDTEGTIEYINPAFTESTGYEPEDVLGKTPAMLNSGEMPEEYFEALWDTVKSGEVWDAEVVDQRRDGELYHAHQTIAPVFSEDGELTRFVAIQTDITEQLEVLRQLKQYRDVVEALDDPILIQNLDGEFELLNEAVSTFAGVPKADLYGTDETAFMDSETSDRIDDRKQEVLRTEESVEYEISPTFTESDKAATFSTRRSPHYNSDGDLVGTFAICRNVTELKSREAELERYERAVNGATDLIAAVDRDNRFLFANPQYRTYHGIEIDEVRDLSLDDVIDEEQYPDVKQYVASAARGQPVEYRTKRTHPVRGTRTFDVRYYPLKEPDADEVSGVVAVLRDVTDSENRARQLSVVDRVLQHNLRNAMTVIRGRAQQIADQVRDDEADGVHDDADSDEDAGALATYIVSRADELLTTSEKAHHITEILSDAPEIESIEIGRSVEGVVSAIDAEFPNAEITVSTPETGEAVASATAWIDRALGELIRNAIVHHDRDDPTVDVTVEATPDAVTVRIADDGPGLSDMNRDVLETGRAVDALYHGSGLGLWLVYWVVEQSGGEATVESATPRGIVVTVTLARPSA